MSIWYLRTDLVNGNNNMHARQYIQKAHFNQYPETNNHQTYEFFMENLW